MQSGPELDVSSNLLLSALRTVAQYREGAKKEHFDSIILQIHRSFGKLLPSAIIEIVKDEFSQFEQGRNGQYNHLFDVFKLSERYRSSCIAAMDSIIVDKVDELCSQGFDEPIVCDYKAWVAEFVAAFTRKVLRDHQLADQIQTLATRRLVEKRTMQVFDMITDFPDSLVAVRELRDCVKEVDMIGHLGRQLRSVLQQRLLHIGASTGQILDFYVTMIKVLRVLDGSDMLLNYVASPVRRYIQRRKDSIRCIIKSLTEANDSSLCNELKGGAQANTAVDGTEDSAESAESWVPTKRWKELTEEEIQQLNQQSRGLDVLATLVSIYGSADLFISEYRSLLAEKMLQNVSFSIQSELVNVELLKVRFGEESLHHCEIMLRDVEDSKRVNVMLSNAMRAASAVSADSAVSMLIISEHYWPHHIVQSSDAASCTLHPSLEQAIDKYTAAYKELKKPRQLSPVSNHFTVDLSLDFDDGVTRHFSVTALQASVIAYIGDLSMERGVTVNELCEATSGDTDEITQAIQFWLRKGVLGSSEREAEEKETEYRIEENQQAWLRSTEGEGDGEAGDTSFDSTAGAAVSAAADEGRARVARALAETYAKGLLRSHGAMPMDRLQTMLLMMLRAASEQSTSQVSLSDFGFVENRQVFLSFLQQLVENGVLALDGGLFSEMASKR